MRAEGETWEICGVNVRSSESRGGNVRNLQSNVRSSESRGETWEICRVTSDLVRAEGETWEICRVTSDLVRAGLQKTESDSNISQFYH